MGDETEKSKASKSQGQEVVPEALQDRAVSLRGLQDQSADLKGLEDQENAEVVYTSVLLGQAPGCVTICGAFCLATVY